MTTKEVIALIALKIQDTGKFVQVVDMSTWDRTAKVTPLAAVGFDDDSNADAAFGLLASEVYSVTVVTNRANESEDIYELIDLVRDTIHENAWGNLDIEPFIWQSRTRVDADPGTAAYLITFRTRHVINAVMT